MKKFAPLSKNVLKEIISRLPDYEFYELNEIRIPVLHYENLLVSDPNHYLDDQITVFVFRKDIKIADWVLINIE